MRQQPTGMHHFFVHPILGSAKVFLVSLLSQIFGIPKNPQDLESSMPMVESWNHPCQWWNHGIIHANGGIMESSMPMVESWNHPCQWWNHGIIKNHPGIPCNELRSISVHKEHVATKCNDRGYPPKESKRCMQHQVGVPMGPQYPLGYCTCFLKKSQPTQDF